MYFQNFILETAHNLYKKLAPSANDITGGNISAFLTPINMSITYSRCISVAGNRHYLALDLLGGLCKAESNLGDYDRL